MSHAASRHRDFGDDTKLESTRGGGFSQGGTFPRHVNAGQITEMEKMVAEEWEKYRQGRPSKIVSVQDAGGAKRITVAINKFGVEDVGAFIRVGQTCTVFPEDDNWKSGW